MKNFRVNDVRNGTARSRVIYGNNFTPCLLKSSKVFNGV